MRELHPNVLAASIVITITTVTALTSSDLVLVRKLSGSGFHRNLETLVSVPEISRSNHKPLDCAFLMLETLPPGVYADPFQIQSLVPFGGPQVLFDRAVNSEAAEFSSKPHELFIYLNMSKYVKSEGSSETVLISSLPIHARYHKPSVDPNMSHSVVTILPPGLYSSCSDSGVAETILAPCDVVNSSLCTWTHLSYKSNAPVVQLHIPVGQQKHIPVVVVITLLVTVTVCTLLIKAIWTSQPETCKKYS